MLQRVMSIFLMKSSRKWAVLQQTKIFKRALSEHKKITTILTPASQHLIRWYHRSATLLNTKPLTNTA
jgi:hypothetical protein